MQQTIKGKNSLLEVPTLLQRTGATKLLLVTGHHLLEEPLFENICKNFTLPFEVIHPPEGVLQTGAIPAFEDMDALVAIGGGKTIDFAKGILYRHPAPLYFIAAPTTAGSGSEATPIAVFYQGKEKLSLDAPHLLPAVAILDQQLLKDLPKKQRAISGADAVAQCIESIWNVHSTQASEKLALSGLALLRQHLADFVEDKKEAAADSVLWAAHLAGQAITLTRTTGPHALSYFLTAHFGVPHGQAVALTLPLFFLYNDQQKSGAQLAKIYDILEVGTANEAFSVCRQWLKGLGLATTLHELQLAQLDLDVWLQSVNQQRFTNNPVAFNAEELKALFRQHLT